MQAGGSERYDRPPVQSTRLTVYFEPLDNFDIELVSLLQSRWGERYPSVSQSPPRGRPPGLPETDPFDTGWPMPAIIQISSSLGRRLSYQFDQVSFSWNFDVDAVESKYPGFETLLEEFRNRFDELNTIVEKMADSPLQIQGCSCAYKNEFRDISGTDWLADNLSEWAGGSATNQFEGARHLGFVAHYNSLNQEQDIDRLVWTTMDDGRDRNLLYKIEALAVPTAPSVDPTPWPMASRFMIEAHSALIEIFSKSASPSMKKSWGLRK